MWKTGHSLIKSKMKETGSPLAGEMSGHVFFADRYLGYDDATYASCRLLEILADSGKTISELLADVPQLPDFVGAEAADHYAAVKALLDGLEIPYIEDPLLVRGLDYYTRTVFELVSTDLGAQDSLLGGGRYDGLVEFLGGRATPAVGFALGLERLVALLEQQTSANGAPLNSHLADHVRSVAANPSGVPVAIAYYDASEFMSRALVVHNTVKEDTNAPTLTEVREMMEEIEAELEAEQEAL